MSVVKWAGGKTKIFKEFIELYNIAKPNRYIDLFCGSLSLPISIKPACAVFNDINSALINLYRVIKNDLVCLINELDILNKPEYNTKEAFNELRQEFNRCKKEQHTNKVRYASLFVYLNKRSYNGLYRENRSGEYNVPYRKYKTDIYNKQELEKLSEYFSNNDIQFYSQDYTEFDINMFKNGDLVYIDPPYYPSEKSQFTSYWSKPFMVKEQKKLARFCQKLDKRGVKFIMSNSPCSEIQELYKDFYQHTFYIGRQMRSGKGTSDVFSKRDEVNEILIWNFQKIKIE